MATIYEEIFVRSPRFISITATNGDTTSIDVYLWNHGGSIPSSPTYTLSKPIPSANLLTVNYDVSPYCREFIKHTSYSEVTAMTTGDSEEFCYCMIVRKINGTALVNNNYFVAFDGFGYYEDGYNPDNGSVFLDEGTYYIQEGVNSGGLYYYDDGVDTWEATYTGLTTGGTTTFTLDADYNYIPYIHPTYQGEGNTLEIFKNSVLQKTFTFEEVCEPKYTPLKCDFVNKYGSWQRLILFKASRQNFEASGTEFNLMPSDLDYNIQENRRQTFNRNAIRSIKGNTGFVPESYKGVMKQLLLSEKILIDDEPVKLRTQTVELQEHITKKLINYELEFEYSHEQRNYVI